MIEVFLQSVRMTCFICTFSLQKNTEMPQQQLFNSGMKAWSRDTELMFKICWKLFVQLVVEESKACDLCNTEKAKWLLIGHQVGTKANKSLNIVQQYISRINAVSIDNFMYALSFIDALSRNGAVHLLRTIAEVGKNFERIRRYRP